MPFVCVWIYTIEDSMEYTSAYFPQKLFTPINQIM